MEGLTEAREIMTQVSTSKSQQKTSSFTTSNAFAYAVCGACGIVFGFAAEKGKGNISIIMKSRRALCKYTILIVYVPSVIINQMLFSQFTMMKMFLSAVAASKMIILIVIFIIKRCHISCFTFCSTCNKKFLSVCFQCIC